MAKAANTRLKQPIAACQARVRAAAERLGKTFSFVPDDKLDWSPSRTARTALAIVAHCCQANRMFAKVLGGEPHIAHADARRSGRVVAEIRGDDP